MLGLFSVSSAFQGMLHHDPVRRITAKQALKHTYFADLPLEFRRRGAEPVGIPTDSLPADEKGLSDQAMSSEDASES